jgi:copper(I)-binding protein
MTDTGMAETTTIESATMASTTRETITMETSMTDTLMTPYLRHIERGVRLLTLLTLLALSLKAGSALAHEYYAGSFTVIHPWALPTEPDATTAAVYVSFEEIAAGDKLVGADTTLAEAVELRGPAATTGGPEIVLKAIDLPAASAVALRPEGMHLQLLRLKTPLQWQRSYPMTLHFEKSGPVDVMVSIGAH